MLAMLECGHTAIFVCMSEICHGKSRRHAPPMPTVKHRQRAIRPCAIQQTAESTSTHIHNGELEHAQGYNTATEPIASDTNNAKGREQNMPPQAPKPNNPNRDRQRRTAKPADQRQQLKIAHPYYAPYMAHIHTIQMDRFSMKSSVMVGAGTSRARTGLSDHGNLSNNTTIARPTLW